MAYIVFIHKPNLVEEKGDIADLDDEIVGYV